MAGSALRIVERKPPVATAAVRRPGGRVDWEALLARVSTGKTDLDCPPDHTIFMQGQTADCVYFLLRGKVRLAVSSQEGKEAIVATLGAGEFFGEGCLAGQTSRPSTATSAGECRITRVEAPAMAQWLHDDRVLANVFMMHLLSRIIRYEADLVDQLFNSSEKRLARMLLLLSHFGKESRTETVPAGVNQEHLAQMVGTTRSRINSFMNKFRKLGFINYDSESGLTVHRGLLSVLQG